MHTLHRAACVALLLCPSILAQDWARQSVSGPTARSQARMVYDSARGKAVLFGGAPPWAPDSDETWLYDGSWSQATPSTWPSARQAFGFCYDSQRQVAVLFGG
ncbi:MAG: hypothetical protein KDC95_22540, partial [Planctomycetes bacterium]|nr:hypothetical protein [Planctomycetota bacterium]